MEEIYSNHANVSEDDPLYLLKSVTLFSPMPYTPSIFRMDVLDDKKCAKFIAEEY